MRLEECTSKGEEDVKAWSFPGVKRCVCADGGSAFHVKMKTVFIALVVN